MSTPRERVAAALRREGEEAPRVVAVGYGELADKIIATAAENGVPVREDPLLAEALSHLDLGENVPPELYRAVAVALLWAYKIES